MISQVGRGGVQNGIVVAPAQLKGHFARDGARHPTLCCFAQHECLGIKPTTLVQQAAQFAAVVAVLLNGVFVVNARDQSLISDEQQSQARCFINAAALGFNDAVFNLIAHAQAVTTANSIGFQNKFDGVGVTDAIQSHGLAFFKTHRHFFVLDHAVFAPERHAHDGLHNLHATVQVLKVFGLVRGAQHVGVGGVGFFGRHLVAKTMLRHEGRHFCAAAQLVNEQLVKPRFVNFERGVGQQTIAIKALNVVALVSAAIAPYVDVVFFHGGHQHGAGHGAANGGGVEVGDAGGRDVKRTALQGRNAFMGQLFAAVYEAGQLSAVFFGFSRNFFVVGFVGLAEVGGVSVRHSAFLTHPEQSSTGVQAARKCNAYFLARGNVLKNGGHACSFKDGLDQPKWQM